ncbi:MAG: GntG family PLP-dependent aldolase [Actinomycetota bacterium]
MGVLPDQVLITLPDGRLDLDRAAAAIKPADHHFADTRLLCLENTHDGKVLPLSHHAEAAELAAAHSLGLHLDGARLWNAAVALGVAPAVVAEPFDTVSVCLSKGLGAPVGSVLVGPPDLIERARKWRKMLGGGMRQSGVLAAAGLYALANNIDRLADDHANAARLVEGLGALDGVEVVGQQTNMAFVRFPDGVALAAAVADDGLLMAQGRPVTRFVTHLDVSADDIETTIEIIAKHLAA